MAEQVGDKDDPQPQFRTALEHPGLGLQDGGCPVSFSIVTAHNEGERQSYIDGINTTVYYL